MKWIRKDLQNFRPYHAAEEKCSIKLDANESPYNLSDNVRKDLIAWLENNENLNIYPDTDSNDLRKALSMFWNVSVENIICGVGSDQIIDYITKVFLEPGDFISVIKPTFSMYSVSAALNHGKTNEIEYKNSFSINVYDIIESVKASSTKILFLCTPNNPTGNSLSVEEIIKILQSVDFPVVVDEAYAEFADRTMIPYINAYNNLIVLRTFSKAYGLAGARVGYAVGCADIIDAIGLVKAPYNLNKLSQILALYVLKDLDEYKKRISKLTENKNKLYNKLKVLDNIKVFPSDANFLFIETKADILGALKNEGILVREFGGGDVQRIRLSIGTEEQNETVYNIIKSVL